MVEHCRDEGHQAEGHREEALLPTWGVESPSRNQKHWKQASQEDLGTQRTLWQCRFCSLWQRQKRKDVPWILRCVVLQLNRTRSLLTQEPCKHSTQSEPLEVQGRAAEGERMGLRKIGLRPTRDRGCGNITGMAAWMQTSGHVLTHTCMMNSVHHFKQFMILKWFSSKEILTWQWWMLKS